MIRNLLDRTTMTVAGIMSGTSLDGIDVAIVRITGSGLDSKVELLHFAGFPYEDDLRVALKELCTLEHSNVARVCGMNFRLAELFAEAVRNTAAEAGLAMDDIDLISSHGQTVWHIPNADPDDRMLPKSTLQIGDLSVIAKRTGKPAVGDFRTADMAAGGQGAPLAPYGDLILFRHPDKGRIAQNIGGIGNCAVIPAAGLPEQVMAFDTGPGNMIIDQVVYTLSKGSLTYDAEGAWAASGTVHREFLEAMLSHPYFRRHPPKTTGREIFGTSYAAAWLESAQRAGLSAEDIVATATAFTAHSIVRAYRDFVFPHYAVEEVIVSGGGARNRTLLAMLRGLLPGQTVLTSDALGVPSDAKEAVIFAVLGNDFIHGIANNLPSATGAERPTVMGKLALP
jgi:anhydro-N-acetylmuramic acid kinase